MIEGGRVRMISFGTGRGILPDEHTSRITRLLFGTLRTFRAGHGGSRLSKIDSGYECCVAYNTKRSASDAVQARSYTYDGVRIRTGAETSERHWVRKSARGFTRAIVPPILFPQ